jgi:hypothetical protein
MAAHYIQLEAAARQVGKSEITLRRLIKSAKISHRKEKTITGFVYLVDPQEINTYYDQGGVSEIIEEAVAEEALREEVSVDANSVPPQRQIRVAVESAAGDMSEYWQKRSEVYEERYNQEVSRHAQAREEVGVWRGKAEQAQELLGTLLPAMTETQQAAATAAELHQQEIGKAQRKITWLSVLFTAAMVTLILSSSLFIYVRWFRG